MSLSDFACENCGKPAVVLHRANQKGGKGIWWCEDCMESGTIDTEIKELTDIIAPKNG